MALGKNEIREANREYYCKTYFRMLRRVETFIVAFIFVIVWQGIAYWMKQQFLKERYTGLAGTRNLQGMEVYDWVELQVSNSKTFGMQIFILGGAILLLLCIIVTYSINNYNLYKHKAPWEFIILCVMVLEIAGIFLTMPKEIRGFETDNVIYFVFMVAQGIILVLNEGILLPVELKKPIKVFGCFLGGITDKLLKNM